MTTIKIDGATITLTPEQLADIDRQRQQPKEPEGLTWEHAFEKVKPKIWNSYDGSIMDGLAINPSGHLNVPSEKHAKSVAALCKLMVIAEAYNMGKSKGKRYYAARYDKDLHSLVCSTYENIIISPIIFFNQDDINQSLKTNRQLWLDFFMAEQ